MFITTRDIDLDIASKLVGSEVTTLTAAQATYLRRGFEQLPKWQQNIINQYINNGAWSDEYCELGTERLNKAIEDARSIIDTDILTLGEMPISKLIALADADTSESYEKIVEKICTKAGEKFLDPNICNEITLRDFRHEEVTEEASLAIYDCDQMLSQIAYAGELASFRKAITTSFPTKFSFNKPAIAGYAEAIDRIIYIAAQDAFTNHHYGKAIRYTIISFAKRLQKGARSNADDDASKNSSNSDIMQARKRILFEILPIDASIQDIGWAINEDWVGLDEHIKFANSSIRRSLLNLGYRKMADLINNPVDAKHAQLKQIVEESLKYIFG